MGRFVSFNACTQKTTLGLWRVDMDQEETNDTLTALQERQDSLNSFVVDHCSGYCDVMLATVLAKTNAQNVQILGGKCSTSLYALGLGLANSQSLKKLTLSSLPSNNWTPSFVYALSKGLQYTSCLEELRIRKCQLQGLDHLKVLAEGFQANTTLTHVEITSSRMDDAVGACMVTAWKDHSHPTLRSLRLEGNALGKETLSITAEWLAQSSCQLQTLDLANQRQQQQQSPFTDTEEGGEDSQSHAQQQLLSNENNDGDGDVASQHRQSGNDYLMIIMWEPLLQALKVNTSLRNLYLSGNHLSNTVALEIWNMLRINHTLEFLCLENNHFSDVALVALAEQLPHLSIRCLKLNGNHYHDHFHHPLTKETSLALLQALDQNHTLEVFTVSSNSNNTNSNNDDVIHNTVVRNQMRHYLYLNRAGRGLIRSVGFQSSWLPHLLTRVNRSLPPPSSHDKNKKTATTTTTTTLTTCPKKQPSRPRLSQKASAALPNDKNNHQASLIYSLLRDQPGLFIIRRQNTQRNKQIKEASS